jgi:hypothetical protein
MQFIIKYLRTAKKDDLDAQYNLGIVMNMVREGLL